MARRQPQQQQQPRPLFLRKINHFLQYKQKPVFYIRVFFYLYRETANNVCDDMDHFPLWQQDGVAVYGAEHAAVGSTHDALVPADMDWSDDASLHDANDDIQMVSRMNDADSLTTTTPSLTEVALESTRLDIRPSRFLPLLVHRDDILTKNFHMQYFFGGILIVILLALAYLIRALPSSHDGKNSVLVDPWSGQRTDNPMFAVWEERLHNASLSSDAAPILLSHDGWHAIQRMALDAPNGDDTTNNTTLTCRVNDLGDSMARWFFDPHHDDAFWSRVMVLHRAALSRDAGDDTRLLDALVKLSIFHLVWSEWFVPLFVLSNGAEFSLLDALYDLQTQWSHGRNWVHHAWRHLLGATRPSFVSLVSSFSLNSSFVDGAGVHADDALVQEVDRRLHVHTRTIPTESIRSFVAVFQHALLSDPSVWLETPAVIDSWKHHVATYGTISLDSLLTRHVPYIDVMLRGKFSPHAVPRISIFMS